MDHSMKLLFTPQEKEDFTKSLATLETVLRTCVETLRNRPGPEAAAEARNVLSDKTKPPPGGEDSHDIKKFVKEQVIIQVRVVFLKLGEIDTLRDRFTADAFVQAKWREPLLDDKKHAANNSTIKLEDYWSPRLYIANSIGELKENVWLTLNFNSLGHAYINQKRRISGTFMEFMELHKFPFDTQDLTISVTSKREESEVVFEADRLSQSALSIESFVDEQEWRLHHKIRHWTSVREEALSTGKNHHNVFSVATSATRRPEFFLWNIMTVQFLIVSLSFATFAVPVTAPQNRIQLSLVLLLTTVSLKFVVNQSLPVIAYLTYLDKYILTSMGILGSICIWHSAANVIFLNYGLETANKFDRISMATIAVVFILLHVIVLIIILLMIKAINEGNKETVSAPVSLEDRKFCEDDSMEEKGMPKMYRDVGNMKQIRDANTTDQVNAQQSLNTLN